MATSLELYEALKLSVGEDAARMIAESLPLTDRVATKSDLERFEERFDSKLSRTESRIFRWMLGFFATLWVSNAAMIVTLLLKR